MMDYKETLFNIHAANLNDLMKACHDSSDDHGWWSVPHGSSWDDHLDAITPTKLALIHSEVSEALEGFRKDINDDHLPDRKMAEVELADVIIRVLDLAGAHDMDIMGAMAEKMVYNWERADHKKENREAAGGKKF